MKINENGISYEIEDWAIEVSPSAIENGMDVRILQNDLVRMEFTQSFEGDRIEKAIQLFNMLESEGLAALKLYMLTVHAMSQENF